MIEKFLLFINWNNSKKKIKMRMTVNIVVFIDCYSTIYIENNMAFITYIFSKKKTKQKAHAYFGRLVFSKFFGGKITPFWKEFRKIKKRTTGACVFLALRIFLSFLAGKLKILNRGLASKKWQKINSRDFRTKIRSDLMSKIA